MNVILNPCSKLNVATDLCEVPKNELRQDTSRVEVMHEIPNAREPVGYLIPSRQSGSMPPPAIHVIAKMQLESLPSSRERRS